MRPLIASLLSILIISSCAIEPTPEPIEFPDCFDFYQDYADRDLIGDEWVFLGFINPESGEEECVPSSFRQITIEFSDTNSFFSQGPCNVIKGDFEISDDPSILISNLGSSLSYCYEPLRSYEDRYIAALANLSIYEIDGSKMILRSSTNEVLAFRLK